MKNKPFSGKQILRQAVSDWFGKEVQTGYTYSYIWMANQFGHFNLGFLFTFFIIWIADFFSPFKPYGWYIAVPVSQFVLWVGKEIYDYREAVKEAKKHKNFPVNKKDIALDAATAVLFISFGLVTAYLSMVHFWLGLISFLLVLLLALLPGRYWLLRKMCFQQAGLPFQYRLSDFPIKIDESTREKIIDFYQLKGDWKILLIFGPRKSGKSSLAAGIGTEHTFAVGTAFYSTLFKFIQKFDAGNDPVKSEGQIYYPWRKADIVIVDDVESGIPGFDIVSPLYVERALTELPNSKENLDALTMHKSVWVLGDYTDLKGWEETFIKLGIAVKNEIGHVKLERSAILSK